MPRRGNGSVRPFPESVKYLVVLTYNRESCELNTRKTNQALQMLLTDFEFWQGLVLARRHDSRSCRSTLKRGERKEK